MKAGGKDTRQGFVGRRSMCANERGKVNRTDCQPWRDKQALEYYYVERRLSLANTGDQLGCSSAAIYKWLHRNGLESRPRSEYRVDKLADEPTPWRDPKNLQTLLIEKGLSLTAAGERLGCTRPTIARWADRLGVKWDTPEPWESEERLLELYEGKGLTTYEVADELGCDQKTVLNWMDEYGIERRDPPERPPLLRGRDSPHWKGGEFPYGEGWDDSKKATVRERDDYRCQECGISQTEHLELNGQKLHVHHIRPAREFDDPAERNAKDNLITLCKNCHPRWELMAPLAPEINP